MIGDSLIRRRAGLQGKNVFIMKDAVGRDYLNKRLMADYEVIGKDSTAAMISRVNPSGMLKTDAGPLTSMVLTGSGRELLVHCVNYNTNRGPYSIRIIPEYNVDIEVRTERDIKSVSYFSPDEADGEKPLHFSRNGSIVKFRLPKLEYYSIIKLEFMYRH